MSIPFPTWFVLWFVVGHFWPVSLLAAGLLSVVAIRWSGWSRILSVALAGALTLIVLSYGLFFVSAQRSRRAEDAQRSAEEQRLTVTLTVDTKTAPDPNRTTVEPGTLPAGSTVRWGSDEHSFFYSVDLAAPARFAGAVWEGHLEHDAQGFWNGTLHGDQTFGAWHCAGAKPAMFSDTPKLMSCVLAQDYQPAVQRFPAGLGLEVISQVEFEVPEGGVLGLSEIGVTLTPHQVVHADEDGRIGTVTLNPFDELKPDPVLMFRGVPVRSGFEYVHADDDMKKPVVGISFELSDELKCLGQTVAPGPEVMIPLTGESLFVNSDQAEKPVPGCLNSATPATDSKVPVSSR
jgi:hypothetical protein